MLGQTISHYKILEKLGEGGMGVVYKAQDIKLDRLVALKFLPGHLAGDEKEKKRFIQEAKAASSLDHPNICTIHEINQTEDEQMFIAMAYYEGETLKEKIERGPIRLAEAIDIAMQIARGLARAHEAGIIHRDIKPANIIITKRDEVKIVDFGLAKLVDRTKLTKSGMTVGTAAYMSPEQAQGRTVDHRSDIFSLGVLLYEMLTGQHPFKGDYEQAVIYSIVNEEPEPITGLRTGVPMALERIVTKALAKNLEDRYQQAQEMLVDMRSVIRELEAGTRMQKPARAKRPQRKVLYSGVIGLILILLVIGIYRWPGVDKTRVASTLSIKEEKAVAPLARNRIAVLPLDNISPNQEDEYFADGMTEELISNLSKIRDLRVIARTSVMQYKNTAKSIAEIGQELQVGTVLEGSVRRFKNQLRITVQLIDAQTQEHLWSYDYDRELKDVFAIQTDVAEQVAEALKIQLLEGDRRQIEKQATESLEAYNLYLQGRFYWNKRTEKGLLKAIEHFNQAVEIDPDYALAYAGLADSYNFLGAFGIAVLPPGEAMPKAKAAAIKALRIDDELSEAHTSLAFVSFYYDWDWLNAEREFKRATKVNPNYAQAHQWYAHYLMARGRVDESIAEAKRAQELDPLSYPANVSLGWMFYWARRYQKAIEQLEKTVEMEPSLPLGHQFLGHAYEQKGMVEEALAEFHKAATLSEGRSIYVATLGHGYAVSGRRSQAEEILEELKALSRREYVPPYWIAEIYAGLGENEQAFEWLQKAYEERSGGMVWLKVNPRLDSLRSDPRFAAFLKKLRLENID